MPEPPPEELLPHVATEVGIEPALPRWQKGELKANLSVVWAGFLAIFCPVVLLSILLANTPALWLFVGVAALLMIGFPFVLRDERKSVRWDEEGITFINPGRQAHHLSWTQDFVLAADGSHLRCDGVRYPLRYQCPATDQAWMVAAVLQHCWSAERKPTRPRGRWWDGPRPVDYWRTVAATLGTAASPATAVKPALFIYKPSNNALMWLPAISMMANPLVRSFENIRSPGLEIALYAVILFFICWLYTFFVRPKQYGELVFDDRDTVEMDEDGLHVWRDGKRSGSLQYPREVSATRGRWLPAGKVTAWSDGEEMYLIDPKRLVALPADTPPRIIFAATKGAGRVGGRILPAPEGEGQSG